MTLQRYFSGAARIQRSGRKKTIVVPSDAPPPGNYFARGDARIYFGRAEDCYAKWPTPVCIIVDGPYGIGGFPGDTPTVAGLPAVYAPHVAAWSKCATPQTTLWFWNSELGWATVHPLLVASGWEFRNCHVWNKGIGHIAGNANSQTLRKFPVITEVCVQYVKAARFAIGDRDASMQEWLRHEWLRAGLPLSATNRACGVKNAATRKYFTQCHLWYFPPAEMFERFASYANRHGRPSGRPYFSIDGKEPISGEEWAKLRAKFSCEVGIANVWHAPAVRGAERLKTKCRSLHNNQKPLQFMDIAINASTDRDDVVWEPFGGLCSATISAHRLHRKCVAAEVIPEYYLAAAERLATYDASS